MTTKTTLRADISAVRTEYGMVLLDERDGRYWQLSRTAAVFVEKLTDGGDLDDAVAEITRSFEVTEVRARSDLHCLAQRLREIGVVTT